MVIYAEPGALIRIGISGETYVREVRFDITDWEKELKTEGVTANATLYVKQGDANYPIELSIITDETSGKKYAVWVITAAVTQTKGPGKCMLSYQTDKDGLLNAYTYVYQVENQDVREYITNHIPAEIAAKSTQTDDLGKKIKALLDYVPSSFGDATAKSLKVKNCLGDASQWNIKIIRNELNDFVVGESVYGNAEAPEQYSSWIEQLKQLGASIVGYVDTASQYARGKNAAGIDVTEGQTGYHDNALYYKNLANDAKTSAEAASSAASDAKDASIEAKKQSQLWAVGTTEASEGGSATNNAKYWSEYAKAWAVKSTSVITPSDTNNSEYWAEQSYANASNPPKISKNGTWMIYDVNQGKYVDTGEKAVIKIDDTYATVKDMYDNRNLIPAHALVLINANVELAENGRLYIKLDPEYYVECSTANNTPVGVSFVNSEGNTVTGTLVASEATLDLTYFVADHSANLLEFECSIYNTQYNSGIYSWSSSTKEQYVPAFNYMGDLSGITGNGIQSIDYDSNPVSKHAPGTLDKYKITYTSSDPQYFEVYNGANGVAAGIANASATVDATVGTPSVEVATTGPDTAKQFAFAFHNLKGVTGDAAGFDTPQATIDANVGTPEVTLTASGPDTKKKFEFAFKNIKGETGDAAGFDTPSATIDGNVGTPDVTITTSGPDTKKKFEFAFKNLKGVQGETGLAAGFGTPTASADSNIGTPQVVITATGEDTAKVFDFAFKNIKGETGEKGDTGSAAGFGETTASVDANVGIPSVTVTSEGPDTAKKFNFEFKNLKGIQGETGSKGDTGAAAGFGTPQATIDGNVGTPAVSVTATGPDTAKIFSFEFSNLKGVQGEKGDKGADGTSFIIKGMYATLEELKAAHPTGTAGEAYAVGTAENNTVYLWDINQLDWINMGSIKGPKGDVGNAAGFGTPQATIDANVGIPSVEVTSEGPDTAKIFKFNFKNIKGNQGNQGDKGDTGEAGIVTETMYCTDTQGITPPIAQWQSTIPTVEAGNYLWTRFKWNNGSYNYMNTKYGLNGSGSVKTVNNISPDISGNVSLDKDSGGIVLTDYITINNNTLTIGF